jgi:phosphoribosyl 1,2-cyclic phosphodiesterase
MKPPHFPVTMDVMNAKLRFVVLDKSPMRISNAVIKWRKVKHPGDCYSYKISEHEKSVIFSTDTELTEDDFRRDYANNDFYGNTDALIIDSQYTLDEAIEKYDWGHSSYSLAVDFAAAWEINNLYLFHHEPLYDDRKLFNIRNSARWYLRHMYRNKVNIELAVENMEIDL